MKDVPPLFLSVAILMTTAWAEVPTEEVLSAPGKGDTKLTIPATYGKLISVVESGGIHYLYLQDDEGNIRIFLLGIKGSTSRARVDLEALPHSIYKIPRSEPATTASDK